MLTRHPEADARMARSRGLRDYWPQLLRYPLRGYCGPVIGMLVLLLTLALKNTAALPGGGAMPTSGLPLAIICGVLAVFYLVRIIDHTTRGYATPPPMGGEALYLASAVKPLALPAMATLSYFALHEAAPQAARAVLIGTLFLLPAYLFVYATEERLSSALNPLRCLKIIVSMGLAYLLPALLLVAGALLIAQISSRIGTALLLAACGYLLFGTAHVLGYLGFKRQHTLGLQVEVRHPDEVARELKHTAQLKQLLARLRDWQRERDEASALRAIESHGGGPLDAIRFFEALYRELLIQGSPLVIDAAGRRLITLLLAARKPARALDIAEGCLNAHGRFAATNPGELEALLREALRLRFEDLYERLLKATDADQHRAEPRWAGVQFLRAQHQSEGRRDDAGALALLAPLRAMTQHPQHALYERTARTLESLLARKTR